MANMNGGIIGPVNSVSVGKYTSFTSISERGMRALSNDVEIIAESEGLFEHSNSIKARKA